MPRYYVTGTSPRGTAVGLVAGDSPQEAVSGFFRKNGPQLGGPSQGTWADIDSEETRIPRTGSFNAPDNQGSII
jgi:hypothetical protein